MAELTINVSDYLFEEEIRKIAEEELRNEIANMIYFYIIKKLGEKEDTP